MNGFNKTLFYRAAPLSCAFIISSCGYNEAIFVTTTSIGLSAETAPPTISVAYDRFEGFIGPTDENGFAPPVVASIASNQSVFNPQVSQIYATGKAALDATVIDIDGELDKRRKKVASNQIAHISGERRVAVFTVNQTTGLRVALNPETVIDSVVVGYRRKEASFLPLIEDEHGDRRYPSTLASVRRNTQIGSFEDTSDGVVQFFATGTAARNLALRDSTRAYLEALAREEVIRSVPFSVRYEEDDRFKTAVDTWVDANKTGTCDQFYLIEFSEDCLDLRKKMYEKFGYQEA